MLKKILLAIATLIVVVLVTAYFVRNVLVKKAVEKGSTYALGVETDLGSANLAITGGSLELSDLKITNPKGFSATDFLTLRRGMFSVDAGSVLDDEVVVDSFIIEGITLNLEQSDRKGNFQELMNNIKRLDMTSSGQSQKFRIGLIAVRDVNVNGSLSILGKKSEKSFKLDNFALRDVGSSSGATISQVTSTVVKALVAKALSAKGGLLPDGLGKNLSELKEEGIEKVKTEATDKLKDLGKSLTGGKK